ncbi:MAG: STAS domain-containing protein [Salinivirgaceae bacterium]|nr:STAS domain-containing protein [Salinivirgaceae bacterium]MBO7476753.1 STAS domain-containing protein [Salinivirgaceae bacterium]MBP5668170.1 STAS domain-containing protein [Salinivirgaceae bacterium]MBR5644504.1 STAS domain-containing protein [Salinivirgaceae bacterium]
MKTEIQQQGDTVTAILEGRLDTAAAPETEKEIQPLYELTGQTIVFDCSKLEYISSSGLRIFLGVLKNAKPKGSRVSIIGLNPDLKNIFAMTGFNHLFDAVE